MRIRKTAMTWQPCKKPGGDLASVAPPPPVWPHLATQRRFGLTPSFAYKYVPAAPSASSFPLFSPQLSCLFWLRSSVVSVLAQLDRCACGHQPQAFFMVFQFLSPPGAGPGTACRERSRPTVSPVLHCLRATQFDFSGLSVASLRGFSELVRGVERLGTWVSI